MPIKTLGREVHRDHFVVASMVTRPCTLRLPGGTHNNKLLQNFQEANSLS